MPEEQPNAAAQAARIELYKWLSALSAGAFVFDYGKLAPNPDGPLQPWLLTAAQAIYTGSLVVLGVTLFFAVALMRGEAELAQGKIKRRHDIRYGNHFTAMTAILGLVSLGFLLGIEKSHGKMGVVEYSAVATFMLLVGGALWVSIMSWRRRKIEKANRERLWRAFF